MNRLANIICLIFLTALSTNALADTKMTWYDGKHKRSVWLKSDLLAEFPANGKLSRQSTVAAGEYKLISERGSVRIWQTKTNLNTAGQQRSASQNLTPVFRDAPGDGGSMRALPGGLILILNPDLTQEQVDAWIDNKQLNIEKELNISTYAYFIKTSPGLASLELANQLVEEDKGSIEYVQSATPNWWTERAIR